jgi:hypothetical protein
MNLEQMIGIIGQIATWVTVLLVFLTLREMEKQRKASQKPELIVPNVSIFGYAADIDGIYIATHWSNEKLKNEYVVGKLPKVTFYNIGSGAAKSIKIKWNFDLQNTVKGIQDYCNKNSLPIIVSSENKAVLSVDLTNNSSSINIEATSNVEQAYLLPASVTSSGLEIDLPLTFLSLISILVFLNSHHAKQEIAKNSSFGTYKPEFEIPKLTLGIEYYDIGGNKYKKKFDIQFEGFLMHYNQDKPQSSIIEPGLHGYFEFNERK